MEKTYGIGRDVGVGTSMDAKVTTAFGLAQDLYRFGDREHGAIAHLMSETGVCGRVIISQKELTSP